MYKPCGGGVSPAIGQWFDFDFSPAISVSKHNSLYLENGRPVEAELKTPPANVDGATRHFRPFPDPTSAEAGAELQHGSEGNFSKPL